MMTLTVTDAEELRRAMREHFVTGERYDGPWNDIGSPERLEQARRAELSADE